jgi:hypothetical protein
MKSISKIERDDYLLIPNPDLVNDYKSINFNYTISSGELGLFFGELQVNSILRVEGELSVLRGNNYINNIPPSGLSYTNIVVNINSSTSVTPTLSAGTGITYSISPSLPTGLSLNTSTGVISGTPTSVQSLTSYTVTATNSFGSTTASISITVNAIVPSGLSYSNIVVNVNNSTTSSPILSAGTPPITYTISPSLPTGLSINSSTGVISGTPTSDQSLTSYTVTATNSGGSTTATINITVNTAIAPSGLSYNSGSASTVLVSTSQSYSPTLSAGTSPTYSISPSLPSGLSINSSTGVISGTTPSTSNDTTYTITATNAAGSTTASFRIRIVYLNTTITVGNQGIDVYDPETGDYNTYVGYGQSNRGNFGSIASRNFNGTTIELLACNEAKNSSLQVYYERITIALTGNLSDSNSTFSKITIGGNTIIRGSANMTYAGYSNGATLWWWDSVNSYVWFRSFNNTTTSLIIE